MDKGQHLRLFIREITTPTPIALATDLTFHLSAATEDSTTKDTTDTNGSWEEYDIVKRSGEINFGALIGVGEDNGGYKLAQLINNCNDNGINWSLYITNGTNNRTMSKLICQGSGKITSINPSGENRQNAKHSGTIKIYSLTVPE